jgi:hypothetical protein
VNEKNLREKGWKKRDIKKALKIISETKKHPKIILFDKLIYWISLVFAVLANFIVAISLIPELIVLRGMVLYTVVATLGISFGLLFELLIRSMEHMKTKHHILLGILIPALAVINFIIVTDNMGRFGFENSQNPAIIGVLYTLSFILPYVSYSLFLKHIK